MDERVPPAVEFLEGPFDEHVAVAPAGPARRRPARVLLVTVVLVALAAAGAVRKSGSGSPRHQGHDRAHRLVPVSARDDLVGPCPAGAQCFASAPAAAASALQGEFPGAVVHAAASILANRAGHSDPGLLRRVILADRGDQLIQIRIQAGAPPGSEPARHPFSSPGGIARVTAMREGYAINVLVIGPGATATVPQADRLARDLRLIATR